MIVKKWEQEIVKNSECCTQIEQKKNLIKALGGKIFKTKQLYQGSKHGFKYKDFHRLCDNKGPTITLMKVDHNNDCIGGFTAAQWEATDGHGRDPSAVVFNLTTAT